MGVIRSVNPFSMSINMGINSGLAGMTFFGKSGLIMASHLVFPSSGKAIPVRRRIANTR